MFFSSPRFKNFSSYYFVSDFSIINFKKRYNFLSDFNCCIKLNLNFYLIIYIRQRIKKEFIRNHF